MTAALFSGANHLCIVTADLDRAVATWADRYGVGPWTIYTKDASNVASAADGSPTPFGMRVALSSLAVTFRIELIQPLDGPSTYADSLASHGGRDHVHHLRLDVADYGATRGRLEGLDLEIPLDAWFDGAPGTKPRLRATYFDTRSELGVMLEIADLVPGFVMPEPEAVYPPNGEEQA